MEWAAASLAHAALSMSIALGSSCGAFCGVPGAVAAWGAGLAEACEVRTQVITRSAANERSPFVERINRKAVILPPSRAALDAKAATLRNHPAFKHLVGNRSCHFVDKDCAH